jgi:hypothetical protein
LDLYVAKHVLENELPAVGDDIEGVFWLQANVLPDTATNNETRHGSPSGLSEAKRKRRYRVVQSRYRRLRTSLMRFTSFAGDGQTTLRCVSKPSTPIDVLAFRFAVHLSWGNYNEDENCSQ